MSLNQISRTLLLTFVVGLCSALAGQDCPALSSSKKTALVEYVRKEYKLGDSVTIKLAREEVVKGTCYRELTFEGRSAVKAWQLTMYLSPDGRFLTSELFDTTLDPREEERTKLQALMAGLSENKGASLGPDHAPVTIVEFSDFQCPYCRKFANIMAEVLPTEADRVRVVFHHMPLSMHPWARAAAEGVACAQLQNSKAFWAMHDRLFQEQSEITAENIKAKLAQIAKTISDLDPTSFQTCLDNQMSLGLVLRDMNLASSHDVSGTPTLFINGHRLQGIKDAAQLRELIAAAIKETTAGTKKSSVTVSTSGEVAHRLLH